MPFTKPNKGSVLVFSLIVLSIVLSAALSVAVVNVSNRKSAGSTGQSVQSFQVADSGVELMLKKIYKDPTNVALSTLGTACTGGVVSTSVSGGLVRVSFFDDTNAQVTDCTSTTWRDSLAKIKVEGTSAGTTRVIETAVAASTCAWKTIHSGGIQGANHVYYNDGADHSPMKVCTDAGYNYYSGACRFVDTSSRKYQGSVAANQQTYDPNWGITCLYGNGAFYFYSNRADSEILCCK